MIFVRSLLVFLILTLPGFAVAKPDAASPSDLVVRIETAERAWLEAILATPQLVSLGTFPDLSNTGAQLTSILHDRLKLLDRKVISNRQWQEHWIKQHRAASELESLYGELVGTASGGREHTSATSRQAAAKDWAALADAKVSNQDDYLNAIKAERDSVEERLENTLGATAIPNVKSATPLPSFGVTPFEERASHIAELQLRQEFQRQRHAAASLELKLVRKQAESSVILRRALKVDVGLVHEEHRIAKAQLRSSDPEWSERWLPIANDPSAKADKI